MLQRSGVKLDSTENPVTPKDQPACPLFAAAPVEIRHMIYRQLLTIPEPIEKAHKHLGSKDTALLDSYKPIPHIDATVLRTCRLVYSEALPILYGHNTFEFSSANAIRSYQSKSLIGYPLGRPIDFRSPVLQYAYSQLQHLQRACANCPQAFNFKLAPMGRLSMLRSVVLNMNAEYRWHSPIGVNGQRGAPNRDHIWRDWSTTLFSESDDLCPWGGRNGLGFPALEKLTLDFTEWQLTESEGLLVKLISAPFQADADTFSQVKPFLKKLGESGGLQELVLKGVKHVPTQHLFRVGLVKEGGVFRAVNQ